MKTEKPGLRFGLYASLSFTALTIITWGLAMMAVPPSGPFCPGDCMEYPFTDLLDYYPRDYIWMYLAIFQLFAYVIFLITQHHNAPAEKKLFSLGSLAFGLIAAIVLLIAYFVQFAVIPISMMKGETEGMALLTQYNGHGIFIALEELGYITMSISFLFLTFVFPCKKGLNRAIRIVLISAFPLVVIAFLIYTLQYGIDRSYRFEVAAITICWLVSITAGIFLTIYHRKKLKG